MNPSLISYRWRDSYFSWTRHMYVRYSAFHLFLACTLKHFVHVHVRHPNSLSLGFNILDAIVAIYLSQLLF